MWGGGQTAQAGNRTSFNAPLSPPHGDPLSPRHIGNHGQSSRTLRRPGRLGDPRIHNKAVSVLHQDMLHAMQPGLLAIAFAVQP